MAYLGGTFNSGDVPTPAIDELRSYNSWVCWKYVEIPGASKPTKPPVSPHSGRGASHSNPLDWGSHKQAEAGAKRYKCAGVGFVLSKKDDFTGIDLDNCRDPETGEFEPWAEAVIALAETYAEISPSKRGVRLFARGKVASTTKCDPAGVEIYGLQRYLTVTEDHIEGTPIDIRPAPQTLEMLLSRVEAMRPAEAPRAAPHIDTTPRPASSGASGGDFFKNVNDQALKQLSMWVRALFPSAKYQDSTGAYRVSSKDLGRALQEDLSLAPNGIVDFGTADMGHANQGKYSAIDIVIEHFGAPDAIAAAKWLCEQMGKTPESLGWVERAPHDPELERIGAQIAEGLRARNRADADPEPAADREADPEPDEDFTFPDEMTRHDGLMGEIIEWVYGTAARPSRVVALSVAISVIAVITGRAFCGPSNSGMQLYVALLGKSGVGKNHAHDAARRLLKAAEAGKLAGAGKFTSNNALEAHITAYPISLCMMDELGDVIAKFNNPRASENLKGTAATLMTLWGVGRGVYATTIYAQRASTEIPYPSLSILGLSTQDEFWRAFQGADVKSGFLNRFLLLEIAERKIRRRDPLIGALDDVEVPRSIVEGLRRLRGRGCPDPTWATYMHGAATTFTTEKMAWGDGVAALHFEHSDWCDDIKDVHPDREPYYARTAEMGLRLATIRALGHGRRAIEAEDMRWGRNVADLSAKSMMNGVSLFVANGEFQERCNHILRLIRDARKTGCNLKTLSKNLKIKVKDLTDAIGTLTLSGEIELKEFPGRADGCGGPTKKLYFPGPKSD